VASLFQILAGAAGLAGISIGFVLLIFRNIIKKNIFPKLSPERSYGILRLIIQLTFAVGIFGVGAWVIDRSHMLISAETWIPRISLRLHKWTPLNPRLKCHSLTPVHSRSRWTPKAKLNSGKGRMPSSQTRWTYCLRRQGPKPFSIISLFNSTFW
jgi:hypothetical protein